jgi:hypothetical protein
MLEASREQTHSARWNLNCVDLLPMTIQYNPFHVLQGFQSNLSAKRSISRPVCGRNVQNVQTKDPNWDCVRYNQNKQRQWYEQYLPLLSRAYTIKSCVVSMKTSCNDTKTSNQDGISVCTHKITESIFTSWNLNNFKHVLQVLDLDMYRSQITTQRDRAFRFGF